MTMHKVLALALIAALPSPAHAQQPPSSPRPLAPKPVGGLYLGADLSYVNEMQDCGAVFRRAGKPVDPFALLAREGGNIVRVRIWNDARWTRYSDLADVAKTIRRARAAGMQVLLDFHYSDDWADGDKQIAPAAWGKLNTAAQAKALYAYTADVLRRLDAQGLMPEMVQVGNETNPELMGGAKARKIDWTRNAALFNAGIKAVRDAGRAARINPRGHAPHRAARERRTLVRRCGRRGGARLRRHRHQLLQEMVDPHRAPTRRDDRAGAGALRGGRHPGRDRLPAHQRERGRVPQSARPRYADRRLPATPAGQRDYLVNLTQTVVDAGGIGVVYWEPNWVSTRCGTRWGRGSNWENAAWFSLKRHEALPAFEFLKRRYVAKPRSAAK